MLSRKGEILLFIKENQPCRTKDIAMEFGNGGHIWNTLNQLHRDGVVTKPKTGYWKALKVILT